MKIQNWFRNINLGLLLICILIVVPSTLAFDGRNGDTITVAAGETVNDDLYIGANEIIIDGTVNGDVFFGGTTVIINGTVNGDVMGGAQEIIINGSVNDDVRVGASVIRVSGSVTGDLMAGGYGVELLDGASVGGDMLAGGYSVIVDGSVARSVLIGALGASIDGSIGGDVKADVGSAEDQPPFDPAQFNPSIPDFERASPGLVIGSNASIGGDLSYEASDEINIPSSAVGGSVEFNETIVEVKETVSTGRSIQNRVWSAAQQWLVLLLLGFLVLTFAPRIMQRSTHMLNENTVPALGWGVLWYFAWPILLFVALVGVILIAILFGLLTLDTIAGIVVGIGLLIIGLELGLYILMLAFIAKVLVAAWLGGRMMSNGSRMIAYAIGALIVVALGALPFVGGIVNFLIAALGLGAVWFMWKGRNDGDGGMVSAEKSPDVIAI